MSNTVNAVIVATLIKHVSPWRSHDIYVGQAALKQPRSGYFKGLRLPPSHWSDALDGCGVMWELHSAATVLTFYFLLSFFSSTMFFILTMF